MKKQKQTSKNKQANKQTNKQTKRLITNWRQKRKLVPNLLILALNKHYDNYGL